MEIAKSTQEALEVKKTKVTEADVIVERTKTGFYYEIKYKEVGKDEYKIGYGSANIHFVNI